MGARRRLLRRVHSALMGVIFSEGPGPLNSCSRWLSVQGLPYPRTCRRCGLGPCKNIVNMVMAPPSEESPPAVPSEVPPTMRTGPFTPEERAKIQANPAAEHLLFGEAPVDWTVERLRREIRLLISPPTAADRLTELLAGRLGELGAEPADAVARAIDELRSLSHVNELRPIADLRQEAFDFWGRRGELSSPHRWVMLWGPSGYFGRAKSGFVGRRQPDREKFAGRFVGRDFELLSDRGFEPTHFSELPRDAVF